jgi:hypothetical protein
MNKKGKGQGEKETQGKESFFAIYKCIRNEAIGACSRVVYTIYFE